MDCLHCGKPLTLLKKWGDARFCSADHERAWKQSIQESMLERLRVSGEQFRRVVQSARVAVAAPDPEPVPVVESVPPPPMAGFLLSRPEPVEPALEPLIRQVVAPADLGIALPQGPPLAPRNASQSFPLSTDAPFVVPVDSALVVAAQSS